MRDPVTDLIPLRALAPLLLLVLAVCGADEPSPAPPDTYSARGIVRQLPREGRPVELYIHHEAIPSFKDMDGKVVGMDSMAMPFAVADPALIKGLAAGDRVAFDFEMSWQGRDPLSITRLEKLPPETRLAFEAGPESSQEDHEHGAGEPPAEGGPTEGGPAEGEPAEGEPDESEEEAS